MTPCSLADGYDSFDFDGRSESTGKWQMIGLWEKKLLTGTNVTYQIRRKGGPMNVREAMCRLNRFISAIINFYHQPIKTKSITIQNRQQIYGYIHYHVENIFPSFLIKLHRSL
jgi:hypothetical protein